MSYLRDQLQLHRINRTRTRVHHWWHANRCPTCAERQQMQARLSNVLLVPLGQLPGADEPETPPKAH